MEFGLGSYVPSRCWSLACNTGSVCPQRWNPCCLLHALPPFTPQLLSELWGPSSTEGKPCTSHHRVALFVVLEPTVPSILLSSRVTPRASPPSPVIRIPAEFPFAAPIASVSIFILRMKLSRVGSALVRRAAGTGNPRWLAGLPAAPTPLAQMKDDFLDGSSIGYLEQLEAQMAVDPASVHRSWANYLTQLGAYTPPPRSIPRGSRRAGEGSLWAVRLPGAGRCRVTRAGDVACAVRGVGGPGTQLRQRLGWLRSCERHGLGLGWINGGFTLLSTRVTQSATGGTLVLLRVIRFPLALVDRSGCARPTHIR
jgi:hypothetical protein